MGSPVYGVDARATLLVLAGTLLTFTAPLHRADLLAYGLAAMFGGLIWRPRIGPALVGVVLPVFFFSRALVGPLSFSPHGLLLALAWLAVLARRVPLRWPRTGYEAPLALLLAAAIVSLLVSEYLVLSVRELRADLLEPVLFLALLAALGPRGAAPSALAGFLVAACATALAAIVQLAFGLGGTEAEGVRRAQAWYPSPNHLALMLGRALPFVVAGALVGGSPLRVPRSAWWLACGVISVGLLLTFSTGGWLGGAVAAVVVVAALGRRWLAWQVGGALALVLVVAFVLAAAGLLPERLNPLRQTGGFRLDLWLSSLEMVRDHPLLGIGPDNFAYLYQQIYLREGAAAEPNLSHPHNWLLHVWLELGLAGLTAFVWLLMQAARAARRALREPDRRWLAAGALGSLADLLVHGSIDNSYFLVDLAFAFWITLAAVAEDGRTTRRPS